MVAAMKNYRVGFIVFVWSVGATALNDGALGAAPPTQSASDSAALVAEVKGLIREWKGSEVDAVPAIAALGPRVVPLMLDEVRRDGGTGPSGLGPPEALEVLRKQGDPSVVPALQAWLETDPTWATEGLATVMALRNDPETRRFAARTLRRWLDSDKYYDSMVGAFLASGLGRVGRAGLTDEQVLDIAARVKLQEHPRAAENYVAVARQMGDTGEMLLTYWASRSEAARTGVLGAVDEGIRLKQALISKSDKAIFDGSGRLEDNGAPTRAAAEGEKPWDLAMYNPSLRLKALKSLDRLLDFRARWAKPMPARKG